MIDYKLIQDIISVIGINDAEYLTAQARLDRKEDPFKDQHPKNYQHGIILETKDRTFRLYAKEYSFKEKFVFVLRKTIEQRDQLQKEAKDRRQYSSQQRPPGHETLYMRTEENKGGKDQGDMQNSNDNIINITNQKSKIHQNNQLGPNESINADCSQGMTQRKRRHDSMKIPSGNRHMETQPNRFDNSMALKTSNAFLSQKPQEKDYIEEAQPLNSSQLRISKDDDKKQLGNPIHNNKSGQTSEAAKLIRRESEQLQGGDQSREEEKNEVQENQKYKRSDSRSSIPKASGQKQKRQMGAANRPQRSIGRYNAGKSDLSANFEEDEGNSLQLKDKIPTRKYQSGNLQNFTQKQRLTEDDSDEDQMVDVTQDQKKQSNSMIRSKAGKDDNIEDNLIDDIGNQANPNYLTNTIKRSDIPKPKSRDGTHRGSQKSQNSNRQANQPVHQHSKSSFSQKNMSAQSQQPPAVSSFLENQNGQFIEKPDQVETEDIAGGSLINNLTSGKDQNLIKDEKINNSDNELERNANNRNQKKQEQKSQSNFDRQQFKRKTPNSSPRQIYNEKNYLNIQKDERNITSSQIQQKPVQKEDAYSNSNVASNAALKHRKQIQERMEIALRQHNEEQQLKNLNISAKNFSEVKENEQNQNLSNLRDEEVSKQASPLKRKIRKRASSRASCNSHNGGSVNPVQDVEKPDLLDQKSQMQSKQGIEKSFCSDEPDPQNLHSILKQSQNDLKRDQTRKRISKTRKQSDIIVLQTEQDENFRQIDSRSRMASQVDIKSIKGIKEKIQDVIDDRGSDLSCNEEEGFERQQDDDISPISGVVFQDSQKFNSYSSKVQLQKNLNLEDSSNYFVMNQDYQIQQRMRSTSKLERPNFTQSSQRSVMMHTQIKIATNGGKQFEKFESNYNKTTSNQVQHAQQFSLTSKNSQNKEDDKGLSDFQNAQYNASNRQGAQGNEKLLEMIKCNLQQLQKFNSTPITAVNMPKGSSSQVSDVLLRQLSVNSQGIEDNPYHNLYHPIQNNQQTSDIFHGDEASRMQLLQKWENKFGKSQMDQNQEIFDSYEWDQDELEDESIDICSPLTKKNSRTGRNTTKNASSTTSKLIAKDSPPFDGFEAQVQKLKHVPQFNMQSNFSVGPQTSQNQSDPLRMQKQRKSDFDVEKGGNPVQLEQSSQPGTQKSTSVEQPRHKKNKSLNQNQNPANQGSTPIVFSQSSKLQPSQFSSQYLGHPINIIQNFNINQLNLVNMCGQNQSGGDKLCYSGNCCNSQSECNTTIQQMQQSCHLSSAQLQNDQSQLSILERIRMSHKMRGNNQLPSQFAGHQSGNTNIPQDQVESKRILESNFNSQKYQNQSALQLKIENLEENQEIVKNTQMPKTSKISQNPIVQKIQRMQMNQLLLDKKQQSEGDSHQSNYQMYENSSTGNHRHLDIGSVNITDASIFSASISKHSSSKSKIILKPSQITKASGSSQGQNYLSSTKFFGSLSVNNPGFIIKDDDGSGQINSVAREDSKNSNSISTSPGIIKQTDSRGLNPSIVKQGLNSSPSKSHTPSPQKQSILSSQKFRYDVKLEDTKSNNENYSVISKTDNSFPETESQGSQNHQQPINSLQLRVHPYDKTQSIKSSVRVSIGQYSSQRNQMFKNQQPNQGAKHSANIQKDQITSKQNDTFDYNWDDETINQSIAQAQQFTNKASIKSKLVLSKANSKGNGQIDSRFSETKIDTKSNYKHDSVRKVIEEASQVSIWD